MEDIKSEFRTHETSYGLISPVKLDGSKTYLAWSRSCLLFIKARRMYGYLTGEKRQPPETDPTFGQWEAENFLVMSWLLSSMELHVA